MKPARSRLVTSPCRGLGLARAVLPAERRQAHHLAGNTRYPAPGGAMLAARRRRNGVVISLTEAGFCYTGIVLRGGLD